MYHLNFVFIGSLQYPIGFAGTKRVQNIIAELNRKEISTAVLLISNLKNGKKGYYNGTYYNSLLYKNCSLFTKLCLPFNYFKLIFNLLLRKKKKRINILYVYSGINIENLLIVLFAKLFGFLILVDVVEDFSLYKGKVGFWRSYKNSFNVFLEKHYSKLVNGIIVISSYLKSKMQRLTKFKTPIFMLPISANIRHTGSPERVESYFFNIVYAGTFGEKEGIQYLLEAFSQISNEFPYVRLKLIGPPDKSINKIIDRMGKNLNVVLTGYLNDDDYFHELENANLLCMTRINSEYANAGFPFKLGEYLATGNPVLATKVSDISLYLEHKISAYLVEPSNTMSIIEGIKYIISNKQRAVDIGQKGKEICSKFFNPESHTNQFINFIMTNYGTV